MILTNAVVLMRFYLGTLSSFSSCITYTESLALVTRFWRLSINNADDEV